MVANKSDLLTQAQVNEEEGKQFANETGVIFQITSAVNGIGINELFYNIGCKLLNIKRDNNNDNNEEELPYRNSIKLVNDNYNKNNDKNKKEKKKCCKI